MVEINTEYVVLVNEQDEQVGIEEKIAAHRLGLLHRAFSIFIFRKHPLEEFNYQVLLHQRNLEKYHCGGLWTNTCCSHPREGENIYAAGNRRLIEEMGIDRVELFKVGSFIYKAEFNNGLIEHELDNVLVGIIDNQQNFQVNPQEVANFKWIDCDNMDSYINLNSSNITPWYPLAWNIIKESNWYKDHAKECIAL